MRQGWVTWSSAVLGDLCGDAAVCPRCGEMHEVEWPTVRDGMVADLGLATVRCQGARVVLALEGRGSSRRARMQHES